MTILYIIDIIKFIISNKRLFSKKIVFLIKNVNFTKFILHLKGLFINIAQDLQMHRDGPEPHSSLSDIGLNHST
jgi:hypothetical protein